MQAPASSAPAIGGRRRFTALVLIGGLVLAGCTWYALRSAAHERDATHQRGISRARIAEVERALGNALVIVQTIGDVMRAFPQIDRVRFEGIVAPVVGRTPSLRAVAWLPEISAETRAAFEAETRSQGFSDFEIHELGAGGERVPSRRARSWPVAYIEPFEPNRRALGFDVGSEPGRRAALDIARVSDAVVASAPVGLIESAEVAVLLLYPVRAEDGLLRGFVQAVLDLGGVFDNPGHAALGLAAMDVRAGAGHRHIHGLAPPDQALHEQVKIAGRTWVISLWPMGEAPVASRALVIWAVPGLILLMTALVIFFLGLVGHRANEAARLTVVLAAEVRERQAAERALHALNSTLEEQVADRTAQVRVESVERQRAESALVERSRQLERAQKMEAFGQLAGGVAHDFNNMLVAILGTADMLLDGLGPGADSEMRDDLVEIRRAGERAAALTRQLLAFSRQQVMKPSQLDLRDVLVAIDSLARRVLDATIELVLHLADEPVPAFADHGQIEQVIVNLLVNARDAMPDGGVLTLSCRAVLIGADELPCLQLSPGRYGAIEVCDTGCGMSPETLERAFDPFFTTKPVGKGTGLGLSTCLGIIRQSAGSIRATSALGQGTRITVLLPEAGERPREVISDPPLGPLRGGSETVLLVEDEAPVRAVGARALRAQGYTVVEACSGEEALAKAHEVEIDLVVSDLTMPGMNGWTLADRLLALRPDLKIMLVSGHAAREARDARASGMPFLQKPFRPADLARRVREVLDGLVGPPT